MSGFRKASLEMLIEERVRMSQETIRQIQVMQGRGQGGRGAGRGHTITADDEADTGDAGQEGRGAGGRERTHDHSRR